MTEQKTEEKKSNKKKVIIVIVIVAVCIFIIVGLLLLSVIFIGLGKTRERVAVASLQSSASTAVLYMNLCVADGGEIKKPKMPTGGGEICSIDLGGEITWPKLELSDSFKPSYGKITEEGLTMRLDGKDVVSCNVQKGTCVVK